MSIFDRINNAEQNTKNKAELHKKLVEETLSSHPLKLECKLLIPVVNSVLTEMSESYKLMFESKLYDASFSKHEYPADLYSLLCTYTVFTKKQSLFSSVFPRTGERVLCIDIGRIKIDRIFNESNKDLMTSIVPIKVYNYRYDDSSNGSISDSLKYDSGIDTQEARKWLEDTLVRRSHRWLKK